MTEARKIVEQTGEVSCRPELLRIEAALLHRGTGDDARVENLLEEAVRESASKRMKWLELRCATDLARIWRDTGRRRKAHDLLSPVYDCFTEGFDTADLVEAKALLDEVS